MKEHLLRDYQKMRNHIDATTHELYERPTQFRSDFAQRGLETEGSPESMPMIKKRLAGGDFKRA